MHIFIWEEVLQFLPHAPHPTGPISQGVGDPEVPRTHGPPPTLSPCSMCNLQPPSGQDRSSVADLDSQLQEQERIINISYALASEASQRSKQVAGETGAASTRGCCSLGLRPDTAWSRPGSQWDIRHQACWLKAGSVCS